MLQEPDSEQKLDQILTVFWQENSISHSETPIPIETALDSASLIDKNLRQKPRPPEDVQHAGKPQSLSHSSPRYYWGLVATLALLVGLFFYLWGGPEFLGQQEIVYQTGYGERLEIDLDDGSHITLNANSELRWFENWASAQYRKVDLKGEAFFEVKKQDGIPFTVNTNDVAVEVLGTSFNVDTREEKTEVYLDEGKVNLKLLEDLNVEGELKEKEIIMKPGEQVRYSAREKKIEKSEGQDLITAASWKKNVLNFKKMEFRDVLELLRDIYGQSFECKDGELLTKPMYLGVPYSDWEAVRQALELSLNIEFQKIASNRYRVTGTNNHFRRGTKREE